MTDKPSPFHAGRLRHKITLQKRGAVDDGYGNTVSGPFADQFDERAEIRSVRAGGEAIEEGGRRNTRKHEILLRSTPRTRGITPTWRVINALHPAEVYAIEDVRDPLGTEKWLILTCNLGAMT